MGLGSRDAGLSFKVDDWGSRAGFEVKRSWHMDWVSKLVVQ